MAVKRLQFIAEINAPAEEVFKIMLAPESYKEWTSAFMEGSYYEGKWEQGEKIRFLAPSGQEGMLSEIAELIPNEFVSIRHIGAIQNGKEDTTSAAVREWAPAYENYTFITIPTGTRVVIDQDVPESYERHMTDSWRAGLERLKEICERG
jgi:uncharacterized protein YndB with AHSA1/START domain